MFPRAKREAFILQLSARLIYLGPQRFMREKPAQRNPGNADGCISGRPEHPVAELLLVIIDFSGAAQGVKCADEFSNHDPRLEGLPNTKPLAVRAARSA